MPERKEEKFMRILVFFDLPTESKFERKCANQFRKFLINDGYFMVQLSVYCRICKGQDTVAKHLNRLKTNLPSKGSIRVLEVTDQQYSRIKILVGSPKKTEKIGKEQLVLF
ncbi:MAG TPA: CRISPR-associated endonuclease Cas2 [Alphaproteobacteria bacterium]|jgi:CRISPR-associated protein Cas2|nr:CRISPR-associated endonuclease Cas2 [Alphaproteobacteria bacterium]